MIIKLNTFLIVLVVCGVLESFIITKPTKKVTTRRSTAHSTPKQTSPSKHATTHSVKVSSAAKGKTVKNSVTTAGKIPVGGAQLASPKNEVNKSSDQPSAEITFPIPTTFQEQQLSNNTMISGNPSSIPVNAEGGKGNDLSNALITTTNTAIIAPTIVTETYTTIGIMTTSELKTSQKTIKPVPGKSDGTYNARITSLLLMIFLNIMVYLQTK
ncbi:unnamed protein product [Gordionus sp. m RMFG-2023]